MNFRLKYIDPPKNYSKLLLRVEVLKVYFQSAVLMQSLFEYIVLKVNFSNSESEVLTFV